MITLEDVSVSFGDLSVLDRVSLSVETGEFVGLVGPNGAGKTTLLRSMNGVLPVDSGTVTVDGKQVGACTARELSRTVATVPQNTHVGFSFTAEQIVEMGRTPHQSRLDWSDDLGPVEEAMGQTETLDLRDRTVDSLSGGERQRVLLARALAQDPAVLLLDEPTASLDINHQVQMLELVTRVVGTDRAAIAAIHDLDLAARFCDRLVLLADGKIRAQGSPEAVLSSMELDEAFGIETASSENPVTGTPTVSALHDRPSRPERIHVVGGGPGATVAIRTLWQAGYNVSIGLVPAGDVSASLAAQLDIHSVTAPAFRQPNKALRDEARSLAENADIVVVTGGPGSASYSDDSTESYLDSRDLPHIYADLGGAGPRMARVDGGDQNVVTTATELLCAVEDVVNS